MYVCKPRYPFVYVVCSHHKHHRYLGRGFSHRHCLSHIFFWLRLCCCVVVEKRRKCVTRETDVMLLCTSQIEA